MSKKSKTTATRHTFVAGTVEREVVRESVFQLVINTNVMPFNAADANRLGNDLQDTLDLLLTDNGMQQVIRHLGSSKWPHWDAIEEIDAEHSVEIGGAVHRLHAQVVIIIKHRSKIHLDRDKIRQFFRAVATEPEIKRIPYVHIQGSASERSAREYVRKGVPGTIKRR